MARARTGQLIWRKSGWYARVWTTIDGERVRVSKALGTTNRAVAKRKLERLLAADNAKAEDAKRPETFEEAAERVYAARIAEAEAAAGGSITKGPREELAQLRRYAYPIIRTLAAAAVQPSDVNAVLDHVKAEGRTQASAQHLRQRMSNVFAALRREGAIRDNPVSDAEMPKFSERVQKERAVLTDVELAIYLAWDHPEERFRGAVRERQTMACIARMFGGLRTGDLHALRWDAFDVERGGFEWGYAPRKKTKRPQLLEVPAMLRPILRDWWERAGRPAEGLVFPVRRPGRGGDRVGQQRRSASHAHAFRRDLQAAFRAAHARRLEGAPAPAIERGGGQRPPSARWRELFDETAYTLPVDFHSWRRAFAQALADADVNAQQAQALTGHASLAAHARYLRNAGKMRRLPAAALPSLQVSNSSQPDKALAKGSQPASWGLGGPRAAIVDAESAGFVYAGDPAASFTRRTSQVRSLSRPLESQRFSEQGIEQRAPDVPNTCHARRPYEAPAVISSRPWVYEAPAVIASEVLSPAVLAMLTGAAS